MLKWLLNIRVKAILPGSWREALLLAVAAYLGVQWWRDRSFIMPVLKQADAAVRSVEREVQQQRIERAASNAK